MPGKHALKVFSHHPGASATIPGSAEVSRWKKNQNDWQIYAQLHQRLRPIAPPHVHVNLKIYPMLKGRFIISKTVSSQDFLASTKNVLGNMPGIFKKRFSLVNFETLSWKLSTNRSRLACDLALRRLWALLALRRLRLPGDIGWGWLPQELTIPKITRKGYQCLGPIFNMLKEVIC